jgi:hypothetical protein
MFLLTERVPPVPSSGHFDQKGLCFWTDPQSGRTFFYRTCSHMKSGGTKNSFVFRFDIRDPTPQWYFVGKLDFCCYNANVSPCGRYFWSMEIPQPNSPTTPGKF